MTGRLLTLSVLSGLAIGIVYTLSPLTILCAAALAVIVLLMVRGITGDERRWILIIIGAAIAARVAAIAGLFALTNPAHVPFGSLFGDEEYFVRRSIWLANVAQGVPIHGADLIYAFDEYSQTSYLYVLAVAHLIAGPSPYGVHLLSVAFYIGGCALLFRLVRSTFGRMPAIIGLLALLFLPSWFTWSIAVLKESLFFLMTSSCLSLGVALVRVPGWGRRAMIVLLLAILGAALETVRAGGSILSLGAMLIGYAIAWLVYHPRVLLITFVAIPIALGAALSHPSVQLRAARAIRAAALQHWGHVATRGYVYTTLDTRFYPDHSVIDDMRADETLRFLARSFERYVTVPLPWEVQSRSAVAFLPEQMAWWALLAFAACGLPFAGRRDLLLTAQLVAFSVVAVAAVALLSGNVGTLVRHRGLALPYLVWLSAVGVCDLLTWQRLRAWRLRSLAHNVHQPEGTCP
jgi:hypothetical protein